MDFYRISPILSSPWDGFITATSKSIEFLEIGCLQFISYFLNQLEELPAVFS